MSSGTRFEDPEENTVTESRTPAHAMRRSNTCGWRRRAVATVSAIALGAIGLTATAWAESSDPDSAMSASSAVAVEAPAASAVVSEEPAAEATAPATEEAAVSEETASEVPAESADEAAPIDVLTSSASVSPIEFDPEGSELVTTDNPDGLPIPNLEVADGTIDENVMPAVDFNTSKTRVRRMATLAAATTASDPRIGVDHPTQPGEVMLYKTATPVEGMVNTWDITLRVEGKDTKRTSDIVLVIDRSGSMAENGRMTNAKRSAKAFVNNLLPSGTTRIAVVSFASNVTTNVALTNNASDLNTAIDGMVADGGTFTQAGIHQARAILENSTADFKNIVLLSDGEPTYSYGIINPENYISDQYVTNASTPNNNVLKINDTRKATKADVPAAQFLYGSGSVGMGTAMFHRYQNYSGTANDRFYNHGNSAIAEAGFAKNEGVHVWAMGLQMDATGNGVMSSVASDSSSFYDVQNVADLQPVFEEIAGKIGAAVGDAEAVDPMGTGFEIPAAYVTQLTSIPETPAATYDATTKKISWNPGTLTTPVSSTLSDVKYAELHYRVEINDAILDVTPGADGYATNGDAQLTYVDSNGVAQTKSFPKPTVQPTLYVVEKKLYDEQGNVVMTDKDFTINVKGVDGTNYEHAYVVNAADTDTSRKDRVVTQLRVESWYTAEEMADGDYSVKYEVFVNGARQGAPSTTVPKFQVLQSVRDFRVIAHNYPAVGKLTITKQLADGSATAAQNATYSGTYECKKTDSEGNVTTTSKGTWVKVGSGDAELTPSNGYLSADKIPANSVCTATEDVLNKEATGVSDNFYTWASPAYSAQPVTIEKEKTSNVIVTNKLTKKPGSVTWTKVDETGATLANSEWTLQGPGSDVKPITDCVADSAGECAGDDKDPRAGGFKVENLAWGDYVLKEKAAPAGYVLDSAERTFTIGIGDNLDGTGVLDQNFGDIENVKIAVPSLPLTGGMGEDWFLIAAGGVGGIALVSALAGMRRKKVNA